MFAVILILLFTIYLSFFFPIFSSKHETAAETKSEKYSTQMKKLWTIAQDSMKTKKTMRAEAALLTILKFDEKNAAAYNRLGILYAREQNFDEAIECFEIAQSLDNNASSLHNAGLIYLETGAYEKAAMAFRQALELENYLPSRYIALAKAEENQGRRKQAVEALESAYHLDQSVSTLRQILAIYEAAEDAEGITTTQARIEKQVAADNARRVALTSQKSRPARPTAKPRTPKIYYPKAKTAPTKPARAARPAKTQKPPKPVRKSRKLIQ